SVLLPVGFTVPTPLPGLRCALTAPFHPYPQGRSLAAPTDAGGLLSVALSLGSPPPGVTRHRVSVEPGLSSPGAKPEAAVRPTGNLNMARRRELINQLPEQRHGLGVGDSVDSPWPPVPLERGHHGCQI